MEYFHKFGWGLQKQSKPTFKVLFLKMHQHCILNDFSPSFVSGKITRVWNSRGSVMMSWIHDHKMMAGERGFFFVHSIILSLCSILICCFCIWKIPYEKVIRVLQMIRILTGKVFTQMPQPSQPEACVWCSLHYWTIKVCHHHHRHRGNRSHRGV